jgi:NAD(P)-dependent dehydrogenase (short-subunit alcohol dehydrogenase family)
LRNQHPAFGGQKIQMARVFITGSADGLGKMAAQLIVEQGHKVVLQRAMTPGAMKR